MTPSTLRKIAAFGAIALPILSVTALSQPRGGGSHQGGAPRGGAQQGRFFKRGPRPPQPGWTVVRGSVYFLERIALPPTAKLHVSLVGRVAGAEYLPLATQIFPARNGESRFELFIPKDAAPTGPYRLQAWIVADNRLMMNGADSQTGINSLRETPKIRMKIVSAPQNIDGIGDGRPLPSVGANPVTKLPVHSESSTPTNTVLKGSAAKLDRRALSPDATLEVTIEDVSKADAPAEVLATRTIELKGAQSPLAFQIPIDTTRIKPGMRVGLRVKVREGGQVRYASTDFIPVTRENANSQFDVQLMNVKTMQ